MHFHFNKFRMVLVFVAAIATASCVQMPKPSVDLLSKNTVPYYVNSVVIEIAEKSKTPILLARLQQALGAWPSLDGPSGRPAKVTVQVKQFVLVSAAQAFLIGGSSTIVYSVEVTDETDGTKIYQIDLLDRVGYMPGGIIGAISVISIDEEDALAKALAKHILETVFKPNNISIARSALKDFPKAPDPAKKKVSELTKQ